MSNTTNSYVHPFAWAALSGQCGEWAVVNCDEGLHDIISCSFLMKRDRIHITGTLAECRDYLKRDRESGVSILTKNLEQYA